MKILMTALVFFCFLSCSHKNTNFWGNISSKDLRVHFDMTLIHTLSSRPTSKDLHPKEVPYLVSYKASNKELVYLVTNHTSKIDSKTHRAIDKTLKDFKPDIVIVEVPHYEVELSHNVLKNCDLTSRCTEGLYAYMRANDLKIKVIGGEPQDREVLINSIANGMSEDEILFFYTFRGVASWRQGDPQRAYAPENPIEEIKKFIRGNKKRLDLDNSNFGYEDFIFIYEKNMSKAFDFKDTRYHDIAPYKDGHYIQKLSVVVDKTREVSILKKLEDFINQSSKVFIVYGSGHFVKHRPVLKKAFESETIISL
jgi:hypothetical protein